MSGFKDAPEAIQEVIGMAMPILLSEKGFSRTEKEDLVYKVVLGSLAVMKYAEMLTVLESVANMHPDANPITYIKAAREIVKSATEL